MHYYGLCGKLKYRLRDGTEEVEICRYAVLEINPCVMQDAGEYTAVAVNQLGEARMSAQLQIHGTPLISI